jgi:hypothetical protein
LAPESRSRSFCRKMHTQCWKILKNRHVLTLFRFVSVRFLLVSVQSKHRNTLFRYFKRNNRNKRLVSDSVETSFGSSFGCFESKLVSQDTLPWTFSNLKGLCILLLPLHIESGVFTKCWSYAGFVRQKRRKKMPPFAS